MTMPWEDYQSSNQAPSTEGPWNDYQALNPLQKAAAAASYASNVFNQSPAYKYTPTGAASKIMGAIQQGADVTGEKTAEGLASKGVNPNLAAGVGTAVQMTPDIAQAFIMPEGEPATDAATAPAQRALGYTKRFLNTPFARGKAAQAAQTALKEDVIPSLGSAETMMANASNLSSKAGSELGALRGSAGPIGESEIDNVMNNLDVLRQKLTKGSTGGAWATTHKNINDAQETIMGLIDRKDLTLNDIIEAKKQIKGATNYLSNNVTDADTKAIVQNVEKSVENIFGESGGNMLAYKAAAKQYGDAESMKQALNNRLSSLQGNMPISLPSTIIAGGKLAQGDIPGALGSAGLWEALKRRGSAIEANAIYNAPRQSPRLMGAFLNWLQDVEKKRSSGD